MKLNLPKPYLSKSQISLWRNSKNEYKKRYFLGEAGFTTKEMKFGTSFEANLMQTQTKISAKFRDFELMGILDFFSAENQLVRDDKTGKKAWDNERAEASEDRKFYSLLVREKFGFIPKFQLSYYETAEKDGEIYYTGTKKSFEFSPMEEAELDAYAEEVQNIAEEISEAMNEWANEEDNTNKLNQNLFTEFFAKNSELESLKEAVNKLKKLIEEDLEKNKVKNYSTEFGSFYFMERKKWSYSESIQKQEQLLKKQKKDEEKNGTAECVISTSLTFRGK